jgi:GxxExxY protein
MNLINDDLTYRVIGCAMNIHKELGNGFQEVIYQRCLAIELKQAGINFNREIEQSFFTKALMLEREELTLLLKVK